MIREFYNDLFVAKVYELQFPAAKRPQIFCRSKFSVCYGWTCTRPNQHDGPHVAHGSTGKAFIAWEDSDVNTWKKERGVYEQKELAGTDG